MISRPRKKEMYEIPEQEVQSDDNKVHPQRLMDYIYQNIIGNNAAFLGPFGRRRGNLFFFAVKYRSA